MKPISLHPPDAWGENVSPAKYVDALLLGIRGDLERKPVTDPSVWEGSSPYVHCPLDDQEVQALGYLLGLDPWEYVSYPSGLLPRLERFAREDPTPKMAMAIEIAFRLGRASITGTSDENETQQVLSGLEKLDRGRKRGGDKTGPYNKRDAEGAHKALKKMWTERHEQVSGRKLAAEACADKCITKLSEERARALFREWARESEDAAERENWATEGWIASDGPGEDKFPPNQRLKSGWMRVTRDNFTVLLFEEEGKWRCRVDVPDHLDENSIWSEGESTESLDEAKAESYAVVKRMREASPERMKLQEKLRARVWYAPKTIGSRPRLQAPPYPLKP
jgi:hypothetical protein